MNTLIIICLVNFGTFFVLGFQRIPLLNIFTRTKAIKKGLELQKNFVVVVITFTCNDHEKNSLVEFGL